jgi:hypothetical protein
MAVVGCLSIHLLPRVASTLLLAATPTSPYGQDVSTLKRTAGDRQCTPSKRNVSRSSWSENGRVDESSLDKNWPHYLEGGVVFLAYTFLLVHPLKYLVL